MNSVIRVVFVPKKFNATKLSLIDYLIDTANYNQAEKVAVKQLELDGFNIDDFNPVVMGERKILRGA